MGKSQRVKLTTDQSQRVEVNMKLMILSMLVMASMVASTPVMDKEDFTFNDVTNAFSSEVFGLGTEKSHCKAKWVTGLWIKVYVRVCCNTADYKNMILADSLAPKEGLEPETSSSQCTKTIS